jgi:hypothetical protein
VAEVDGSAQIYRNPVTDFYANCHPHRDEYPHANGNEDAFTNAHAVCYENANADPQVTRFLRADPDS